MESRKGVGGRCLLAKKGSVVPPVHRRIRHGACPGPVEGGKQRGRMDWPSPWPSPRTGEGMGGGRGGFTAEGAESAEGEEGLALTPVSSTGQALALALSHDGRGDGRREGGWERRRGEMSRGAAFCCISACYSQVVRRWSRGDSRIGLTGGWTGDGEGRIHRGGRRERRGRGGLALTPVSSTGQALALSQDGSPHPRIEHGAGSRPLPGRERGWERSRAGNVASRCILLHFRLLLSSCEALE